MISPELLRRHPFFGPFDGNQLSEIAMIANEIEVGASQEIFEECGPADTLYLLLEGGVSLYYKSEEEFHPKASKEFSVGEINPGEMFAVSSLIEPYVLNATARTSKPCKLVKIDAVAMRQLFDKDNRMGYIAMQQITQVLMERLAYTRVQLAAAWA
ncbi:MAG: Crp/Fnr family transcriptional regulator [Anaerolineales bacterium]|nr:Crp/Fnr family transcriptional regulator [Anaerolineales bacterium]